MRNSSRPGASLAHPDPSVSSPTRPHAEGLGMALLAKHEIPHEQINNGALILLLLRECKNWEELCRRFAYADPEQIVLNTTTMELLRKLRAMREAGLVQFEEKDTPKGKKPVGAIIETERAAGFRVALGGLSLSEVALISRPAKGMAVAPIFGRPTEPDEKTDVFVLMPFKKEKNILPPTHITKMVQKLGLTIRRADAYMDADRPFIQKIWSEICNARLIVADCTDRNPNVFYEIGMAHTVGKTVVLITRSRSEERRV